jgi:ATP-dependent RNA helicase DDX51/DBP6
VLVAARKASAPKIKDKDREGTLNDNEGSSESGDEETQALAERAPNAEAVSVAGAESKTEMMVAGPSKPKVKFDIAPQAGKEAEVNEVADKERRKREKREKRANRHLAKAEPADAEPANQITVDEPEEISITVEDPVEPAQRSLTPPLLEAFPLPTLAPAPKASVLSRQGLPAGLENATFVDQDTRIPVASFARADGKAYLSDGMKTRLTSMGISDFFAGTRMRLHTS